VVDRIKDPDQPGLVVAHGLGSGKTLTSIAAQEALGTPSSVVVPAALRANYEKERKKHLTGKSQKANITSMQNLATKKQVVKDPLMIVDEAHRAREPSSATFQALKSNESQKRLLMTGSPFYNHPADIAPLIDLAADAKVLPFDRKEFTQKYISEKVVKPSWTDRALNLIRDEDAKVKPGNVPVLYDKRAPELKEIFNKWVDYHPGSTEGFPTVNKENVDVPMSKEQLKIYDTLMDKAPAWVAMKVRRGLPPDKQEAAQLNSFLTAARQASNTTAPFTQQDQPVFDPKIDTAFNRLKKNFESNPNSKAVVYSNYLDAGINPYKQRLDQEKIPYGEFTGEMPHKKRDQLVRDYNEGKIRALLLSSAGGEGLDLKGTRLMQILEPHWNLEKLKQVEGRGARYLSHADLPEDQRNLQIENYRAIRPEAGLIERLARNIKGYKKDNSVDEYLSQMSKDKENLIQQFRDLLPNAQVAKTAAVKKQVSSTEASRELQQSWRPLVASHLANTIPGALSTASVLSGIGPEAAFAGAAVGGALGYIVADYEAKELLRSGKRLAKDALKTPSKENALIDSSKKIDWGEVAESSAKKTLFSIPAVLKIINIKNPKLRTGLLAGMAITNIGSSIGSGYLEKYKKMIAVNELENVRKELENKDSEKLHKLRRQVSKLEDKVEGDGWKKIPSKQKDDWK